MEKIDYNKIYDEMPYNNSLRVMCTRAAKKLLVKLFLLYLKKLPK